MIIFNDIFLSFLKPWVHQMTGRGQLGDLEVTAVDSCGFNPTDDESKKPQIGRGNSKNFFASSGFSYHHLYCSFYDKPRKSVVGTDATQIEMPF